MTYFAKDPVYVLSFEPRWGEDYKGTIYVSMDDFAVLRIDFENVVTLTQQHFPDYFCSLFLNFVFL